MNFVNSFFDGFADPERARALAGAIVALFLMVAVTMPRRRSRTPHPDRP